MKNQKNQPKLDDLKKENPFEAPEGYFENLPDKIMSKIGQKQPTAKVVRWQDVSFKWSVGIAASLLVGAFAMWIAVGTDLSEKSNSSNGDLLAEIDDQDILDYLEYSNWVHSEELETMDVQNLEGMEEIYLPELNEEENNMLLEYLEEIG